MFIPKNRILFEEIDPEKTDILGNPPKSDPPPAPTPKPPKKEPFNGLDLGPVMEKIDLGFKELNDKLAKTEPKKRDYQIGDEFDPLLVE